MKSEPRSLLSDLGKESKILPVFLKYKQLIKMTISFGEIADKYITKKGLEDLTEADEIEIASEICGERVNKYVAKYIIYKYTWQHHTRTSDYGSYIDEDKLEIFNNLLEIPFSKFFEYFLKSHYKFNTEESEDIINYIVNNKFRIKSKLFIDWLSNPSIPDEIKYYNTRRRINSFMTFMMYLDDPEILIEYIRNHEIYSKMKTLRRHLNKIKRAKDIELKLNEELDRYNKTGIYTMKAIYIAGYDYYNHLGYLHFISACRIDYRKRFMIPYDTVIINYNKEKIITMRIDKYFMEHIDDFNYTNLYNEYIRSQFGFKNTIVKLIYTDTGYLSYETFRQFENKLYIRNNYEFKSNNLNWHNELTQNMLTIISKSKNPQIFHSPYIIFANYF